MPVDPKHHHRHSVLRERIVEHRLVADILARLWTFGRVDIELLRAEFDRGGYDLVMDLGGVSRQIQLKCSHIDSRTAKVPISNALARQRSGCVLWLIVDDELKYDKFLWFGGIEGKPLPSLDDFPVLKRTTFNSVGDRPERDGCNVPKRRFKSLAGLDEVIDQLFGKGWQGTKDAQSFRL